VARNRVIAPNIPFYFHALNLDDGTPTYETPTELSMYFINFKWLQSSNEEFDFNESVQWYQSNVITGGRDV
jgi:hypothetical protein